VFEAIWDKMQATSHQTQKEKLEQDLKTQIKKLQRLRDQIKTWLQSNEVKDKTTLTDTRKLIETVRPGSEVWLRLTPLQQMERFKACEKEMKTKAFSKEGLSLQAKLDPKEQLKIEVAGWVANMVDELGRQVEGTEAEMETLAGAKKKSAKSGGGRAAELDQLNDRRKWHINRLELILRLLENGNLEPDSVSATKEDIAYFVESNTVRCLASPRVSTEASHVGGRL
jgi:CCR4-NOT transcription complex subunit 3